MPSLGLHKKWPLLVPDEYCAELATMNKAALLDMVWSLAGLACGSAEDNDQVIAYVRKEMAAVRRIRQE